MSILWSVRVERARVYRVVGWGKRVPNGCKESIVISLNNQDLTYYGMKPLIFSCKTKQNKANKNSSLKVTSGKNKVLKNAPTSVSVG